jgi:site-specific recombinase XerD
LKISNKLKVYFASCNCLSSFYFKNIDNNVALFVVYQQGIRRLTRCQARKNLAAYRDKFGVNKRVTHHLFRRRFCSLLLDKGATIKEVQYLARHKSERTTLRFYCKASKEKVRDVHKRIFNEIVF